MGVRYCNHHGYARGFEKPRLGSSAVETAAIAMSTIQEVRTAEKRVQEALEALKKASAQDPDHLSTELINATDDYARAVRELNSNYPTT